MILYRLVTRLIFFLTIFYMFKGLIKILGRAFFHELSRKNHPNFKMKTQSSQGQRDTSQVKQEVFEAEYRVLKSKEDLTS